MADELSNRPPTVEETELTVAETARVNAETAKLAAETAKLAVETTRALSDAENARNMAVVSRLAREHTERDTAALLAGDEYNRVYRFGGTVSEGSVKLAIHALTEWHRLYPAQPFEIIFNSGGGDVVSGLALYDFILDLRHRGHFITTSALGEASSMAGILLQAGDKRTMGREAWLMIHEASFHAEGKTGEVEDRTDWIKRVQERVLHIFAERSHLSVDELREHWSRRNWWIDSTEALRLGLVDELR